MEALKMSKRQYRAHTVDEQGDLDTLDLNLENLINHNTDWEVFYSLDEEIDNILDLQIGQSLFFQANRDNPNQKGTEAE